MSISIDLFPQNAIFHNFPQIISFKHGFCSFPRISRTLRSTKSHSGFMEENTSHNMCGLLHGDPTSWWLLESVDPTPSQPPGTDTWDSGMCRLLCAASQSLDSLGYKHWIWVVAGNFFPLSLYSVWLCGTISSLLPSVLEATRQQ